MSAQLSESEIAMENKIDKLISQLTIEEKEEYKQLAKDYFSKLNEATRQDLGMSSSISKSRAKAHLKNPSNDGFFVLIYTYDEILKNLRKSQ